MNFGKATLSLLLLLTASQIYAAEGQVILELVTESGFPIGHGEVAPLLQRLSRRWDHAPILTSHER